MWVWELFLLDFLHMYLPAIIFGMVGAVSILSYLKMKKRGYLIISVGFFLLAVGTVALPILKSYVWSYSGQMYTNPFVWLYLFYVVFSIVPAVLILAGLILLYKETKQN